MSNVYNLHTQPRNGNGKPPPDTDAPKLIKLAAGLLHGVPTDLRPADCGAAWYELADGLTLAASTRGPAGVDAMLTTLERDHPNIVKAIKAEPRPRLLMESADAILDAERIPIKTYTDELLTEGLTVLGGRPKAGKSRLALQMTKALGQGGEIFGRQARRCRVLYIAYEDNKSRLQTRMDALDWPRGLDVTFSVQAWPLWGEDNGDALQRAIMAQGFEVVIIDTASRWLGGADQLDMGQMNVAYSFLQSLAINSHAAILLIDHIRKLNDREPNPVEDILGSTGKVAPADAVAGIYRKRGKGETEARLIVVSRDQAQDTDLTLEADEASGGWRLVGETSGIVTRQLQQDILAAAERLEGRASIRELQQATGKGYNHVVNEVDKLVEKGLMVKVERGVYGLTRLVTSQQGKGEA